MTGKAEAGLHGDTYCHVTEAVLRGHDLGAPDVGSVHSRYPEWRFGQEGDWWTANHPQWPEELRARSPESLEGKVARADSELQEKKP